jgi:hypothetical protein
LRGRYHGESQSGSVGAVVAEIVQRAWSRGLVSAFETVVVSIYI